MKYPIFVFLMTWLVIGVLILIGLGLIGVELIVIPGTTVVGIIGVVSMITGIYMAYSNHGTMIGHYTLGISTIIVVGLSIAGYKTFTSQRFSVKQVIDGKVNVIEVPVKVGDKGKALSALRPSGKGKINDNKYEVTSMGEFIEVKQSIEVIKVDGNKIFVKKI